MADRPDDTATATFLDLVPRDVITLEVPVFRIEHIGETAARPEEIAPGVYRLATGRGLAGANVYLVRSGPRWVLIDTACSERAPVPPRSC